MSFDVAKDTFPLVGILDPNPGKTSVVKYAYNQDRIAKNEIEAFVHDFLAGRLLPHQRSESTPTNRAPGFILPLNSESFDQLVMNKELDVFVLFYTTNQCNLCE